MNIDISIQCEEDGQRTINISGNESDGLTISISKWGYEEGNFKKATEMIKMSNNEAKIVSQMLNKFLL